MIVLYEENEINFTSLGLGVLSDPISCIVTEGLNDNFELEMVYPVTGKDYSKLKIGRLISSKTNPYDENAQPFRITSITKPINGKVTVNAVHISYDTNGIIIGPIKGNNSRDTIEKIQNGFIIPHNFKIYTDISVPKTFTTNNYYNLRALLMGDDSSLINVYNLEASFDKFKIFLNKIRGAYRGTQIRYAKNMKDLTHVISYEKLYNGVYPFYHQEVTETTTNTTQDGFQQVYIVGNKPFQDGWLSYTDGGEPYHPVDEAPVQIGTEGDYYGKVYCWNTDLQRFQEKLYNETVTIIEGVMQPEWIFIDWSALPTLTCRAKKEGYFKLMTETEWTFHKVDEIVFQGSFKDVAESLIMYYSEVIPGDTESEITETESITHVELKDKIIWVDTEAAKSMLYNRILSLDLTSEFENVPTEEELELKAKEYIEKNKIGQYKYETRVSFVDLSRTTEGVLYKGFDKVLLGDIIKVVYEDMNVDIELRVISTKYDALKDAYDSVDLGEKPDKISSSSVQNGDGVSALTNDVGYADVTTVNKLIAKTITADYIKAVNATLTKAQIEELETARIRCSGIIEASQFELDSLVAKLLVADNAVIKETLEAGTVKVNGDITVSKGYINIHDDEKGTVFNVDREGNLIANSVKITGGSLNINDGTFEVTPDGILYATGAVIRGEIHALSGEIAQFTISEDSIYNGIATFDEESSSNGVYIGTDGIRLGNKFTVDDQGNISIKSGSIQIQNGTGTQLFSVTSDGKLTATGASISGSMDIKGGSITIEKTEGDKTFYVSNQGDLQAKSVLITGGTLNINDVFKVSNTGKLEATGADISGKVVITEGSIEIKNDSGTSFKVLNTGATSATSLDITGASGSWNSLQLRAVKNQDNTTRAYMAYGKDSFDSASSGIYVGTDGLSLGSSFKVTPAGALTASSVSISGGTMGWSSTGKSFNVNSDGSLTATGAEITGNVSITSGSILIESSSGAQTFKVDPNGNLISKNAEITGKITATSGYIGNGTTGFTIDSTKIYNTKSSLTANSNGIYIGTDGISLGPGETFKVTNTGALKATSVDISGTISSTNATITGGSIGGFAIANNRLGPDPESSIGGSTTINVGTVYGNSVYADVIQARGSGKSLDYNVNGIRHTLYLTDSFKDALIRTHYEDYEQGVPIPTIDTHDVISAAELIGINIVDSVPNNLAQARRFRIGYKLIYVDGSKSGEGYKKTINTELSTIVSATATIYIDNTDDSAYYADSQNLNIRWDGGIIKVISKYERYVAVIYIGY